MLCFNPPYPDNGTGAWTFPLYQAKRIPQCTAYRSGAEFYRIAWNKDFKSWHSENFDETIPPLVILEHAALAAYFMTEKSWTFCPYTTAIRLQKNGACIYELKNSPPEQVVYYLVNENRKTATIHKFLELLTEKLKTLPKDKITSFLS